MAGVGKVDGRRVACFSQDATCLAGALGEAGAARILRIMEIAEREGVPLVGFVESSGARLQEGSLALGGYGRIFRKSVLLTNRIPQISVVSGLAAGGGSYSPALTDFVVMTQRSAMFLTGPRVVKEATGEDVSEQELGGPTIHQRNGVCDLVTADDASAPILVRKLLSYLPQAVGDRPPRGSADAGNCSDPGKFLPLSSRRAYDIRLVIEAIVDEQSFLELSDRWGKGMVTGLARVDGRSTGVLANQPRHNGGVIDIVASQKGSCFVDRCEQLRLPILVIVDTPGFMPGVKQEAGGAIRFGASLVRSFARATVPRVTIIARKAYGGAYIAMNSKHIGAHFTFAWPEAEIGIMSPDSAVELVYRKDLENSADRGAERSAMARRYREEHLRAEVAVDLGAVDEIIQPRDSRSRVAAALSALAK